jgi:hypothetical protein
MLKLLFLHQLEDIILQFFYHWLQALHKSSEHWKQWEWKRQQLTTM